MDDTIAFISALFMPEDWIELRLLPSRAQKWVQPKKFRSILQWLKTANEAGQHVYFGANPRTESGKARNDGVAVARSLFVDIDDPTITPEAVKLAIGEANLPEPSIVTMTGGGSHCYWLLDEPMADMTAWAMRMRALIRRVGSDPGVHDAARILRLPGFINQKYPHKPLCRLVECHPERTYPIDEFPAPPQERPEPRIEAARGSLSEESFAFVSGKLKIAEGTRRDTLFRIACDFAASGWTLDQCVNLMRPCIEKLGLDDEDIYDLTDRQIPNAFAQPREPTRRGQRIRPEITDGLVSPNQPAMVDAATGEVKPLSEALLGAEFCAKHGCDLMYEERRNGWLAWNGKRWVRLETDSSLIRLREFVNTVAASLELNPSERIRLGRASVIRGIDAFVKQECAVKPSMLDADPMLLGTPSGVVDLASGIHRPARREDRITRATATEPADTPDCPLWLAFLREAMRDDQAMIEYLQRIAGYCLTGLVSEHALIFAHGAGGNGKGVWIGTLTDIWADYANTADMEVLCETQSNRHPTEIAALDGPRLIAAQEIAEGKAWNEARLKSLTGGDQLSARYMRQDLFSFDPQFKLIVAGNHQPRFRTVDDAIRRRLHLIPFLFTPAKPDPELRNKLRAEWPQILRWAIDGCIAWQHAGLDRPAAVKAATDGYLGAEDHIGQWCDDCLDFDPRNAATSRELTDSWAHWSESVGIDRAMTPQRLREAMERRGAKQGYVARIRGYRGVAVRDSLPV
jgi:putative DNA primase/helicase